MSMYYLYYSKIGFLPLSLSFVHAYVLSPYLINYLGKEGGQIFVRVSNMYASVVIFATSIIYFFNSFFFQKLADLDRDPSSACDGKAAFELIYIFNWHLLDGWDFLGPVRVLCIH
ncbi:hypothetical protein S83_019461 [Arachis hypogaea]